MPDRDAPEGGERRSSLDRIADALRVSPGVFLDAKAAPDPDVFLLLRLWADVTSNQARRRILSLVAEEARRCGHAEAE